jgi:hypothetical protein
MRIRQGTYYECGSCGDYHYENERVKDCRDDSTRFSLDGLQDENGNELSGIELVDQPDDIYPQ